MDFEGNTPFTSLSYNNTVVLPKGLLSSTNTTGNNMHTIPTMANNTNTESIFITTVMLQSRLTMFYNTLKIHFFYHYQYDEYNYQYYKHLYNFTSEWLHCLLSSNPTKKKQLCWSQAFKNLGEPPVILNPNGVKAAEMFHEKLDSNLFSNKIPF